MSATMAVAESGSTTKVANTLIHIRYGAKRNSGASAPAGTVSSFRIILIPSASHCSQPPGPTRLGPMRDCMRPQILRSQTTTRPVSGATSRWMTSASAATSR